ncbi:MAG: hypothetical protein ACP5HG_18020, partial [Anaerolineae bacterium]
MDVRDKAQKSSHRRRAGPSSECGALRALDPRIGLNACGVGCPREGEAFLWRHLLLGCPSAFEGDGECQNDWGNASPLRNEGAVHRLSPSYARPVTAPPLMPVMASSALARVLFDKGVGAQHAAP